MNEDVTLSEFKDMYINNNIFFQDTIQIIKYLKKLEYMVCLLSNLKEIDYEKFLQNFDTSIFGVNIFPTTPLLTPDIDCQ